MLPSLEGGPEAPWLMKASLLIILTRTRRQEECRRLNQQPADEDLWGGHGRVRPSLASTSLTTAPLAVTAATSRGPQQHLTQQVSREVDGQDDSDREDTDDHQQADDVALEGQVVDSVLATLLPDLFVPAGQVRRATWWR